MMHCEIHKAKRIIERILPMVPQHYSDACETDNYDPVDVDLDYYMMASDNNQCFIVTLNDADKIVGYSIFTLASDPIRKGVMEAMNTCLYVIKGFRGAGTKKLIQNSTQLMKELGADKITYAIKNKALARMLRNNGYTPQEIVWSMSL